jgi:class 3 adenylate cyclase
VLIHAQALRSLLGSGLLRVLPSWGLVLIGALLALVWCVTSTWLRALCAMVLGWMALLAVSTAAITHQWYLPICGAGAGLMLAALGRAGLENGLMLIERRRLRRAFAGAVSPAVLGEVLSGRLPESERVHACVLFSDIRGFTTRSEAMAPEQVIAFLNEYFEEMVAAIHDAGGTLDKFIGDGIMAFFGAPVASDAPCKGALEAANNMLASLARFNQDLSRRGEEPVRIGIGLHVGDVVVGQVGSRTRREYTAVGDVVNTASRLEGLTKDAGRALIISQAVFDALDGAARQAFEPLGAVPIRGRSDMPAWGLK